MSNSASRLPAGFETLEPFVDIWAIEGANNRAQARLDQGEAACTTFYNAAKDLVPLALEQLDKKPLSEFDEAETRLMNLVLSFAHASLAAEIQRDDEARHAVDARYLPITHAPADANA